MKNFVCSSFGHRTLLHTISQDLTLAVENLILQQGVTVFMTGGMGAFDDLFAHTVRSLKTRYPQIRLLLVKPYFSNELNTNKTFYQAMYDEVILPDAVAGVHPKAAITKRNRWMVENSDVILAYVHRTFGGAYTAIKYAKSRQIPIMNLCPEN